MARAFQLKPGDSSWGRTNHPEIEATHIRTLPGVRCPDCGAWAITGIIYPSVDVSLLDAEAELLSPWPVPFEEFRRMAARIQPILGDQRPLFPGSALGYLRGRAKGSFGDFAWVNPWTPLVRQSVWVALTEARINLVGVPAELSFGNGPHEAFVELEALPKVHLPGPKVPLACAVCGRQPVKRPDNLSIDTASFDNSIALQRIRELPTVLIINEPFAEFIQKRGLRDGVLTPVAIR